MTCSNWASHPIYVRMKSGIYSITNLQNEKVYYGSSTAIEARWRSHKSKLRKGKHPNPHLQSSWNKYGENCFLFKIEEEISSEQLQETEQYYLDWCKLFSFWSYNIGYDSECPTRGIKFGPPSEEHRKKIGLANKGVNSVNFGKKLSEETRQRMSESKRGIPKPPRTEEHKKKLGMALKGKVISEKTIQVNSKRFSGTSNPKYDPTIYTFSHHILGVEKCTQRELRMKYGLESSSLSSLLRQKQKTVKGWYLI